MSIVLSYIQLCNEDYNWWWRSFITSGAIAVYVFLYSMLYFSRLEASMFVTYMVYLGYMVITCSGIFLATGTIGALSSYYFIYSIYASIKVD
jgi:transmembrane 9 superfamily member 2/4